LPCTTAWLMRGPTWIRLIAMSCSWLALW